MTRRAAIIWVWGLVLIAGAVGGGFVWWRQQDVAQAYEAARAAADADRWEEALTLAQPYAERDDPRINGLLADAYINGPDSIQDIDKGLTLRRRAAEAGNMRAAYFLARWILENEPTDAQAQEAIGYLQEAADCGMPMANYDLGIIFSNNDYAKLDYQKAIVYSEYAAFAGVPGAAWNAGVVYAKMIKNDRSLLDAIGPKSMYWLLISKKNGDIEAKKEIEKIRGRIETSEGIEYSKKWFETLNNETNQWAEGIHPLAHLECVK